MDIIQNSVTYSNSLLSLQDLLPSPEVLQKRRCGAESRIVTMRVTRNSPRPPTAMSALEPVWSPEPSSQTVKVVARSRMKTCEMRGCCCKKVSRSSTWHLWTLSMLRVKCINSKVSSDFYVVKLTEPIFVEFRSGYEAETE
jgi:hypothetical protein